jgi:hypothetical protein
MAAKVRMLKLLQELRGFALITNRQPPARLPGLVLMQLRSHLAQTTLPRRRLNIRMDPQAQPPVAHPVRIVHVKPASAPTSRLPAP